MNLSANVDRLKLVRTRATSIPAVGDRRVSYGTVPLQMSFSHQEEESVLHHTAGKPGLNTSVNAFDEKLRRQAQQLHEQNETLKSRVDVISSSVAHLNERIRKKDEEYNRIASNLQQKSSECYDLREQADQLARKNKQYKRQAKDMEAELKDVREQLRVERQMRVQLQAEKNSILQKLQYLKQSGQALAHDIIGEQLEQVAAEYQSEIDRLNEANSTLTMKLNEMDKQMSFMRNQSKENHDKATGINAELQMDLKKANDKTIQLQEALRLAEREKQEWQQQRPLIKETATAYEELLTKYEKLEGKYQDLVERYNQVMGKQLIIESQLKEVKSRLRLTEQEKNRYKNQNQQLQRDKSCLLQPHHSRQPSYNEKVVSSSFLEEEKSLLDEHQVNQTSSLSINNFASLNLPSAHSKKPLGNVTNNDASKSSKALGRLIHDSSKQRVAVLRSQSQDDNILMTEQYIPTGEHTDSRVEGCGQRKAGGIRSRCRNQSNVSNDQRQNESPVKSAMHLYNNTKRQPQHSQLSNIASDQQDSSDKGEAFQKLLNRFEQLKSRSRQRVL